MPAYYVRKFLISKAFLISIQTPEVHSCLVEHSNHTCFSPSNWKKDQDALEGAKITG